MLEPYDLFTVRSNLRRSRACLRLVAKLRQHLAKRRELLGADYAVLVIEDEGGDGSDADAA